MHLSKHVSFQWSICLLYGYDSHMQHPFKYLDRGMGTSGPNTLIGPMVRTLSQPNIHLQYALEL